MKIQSRFGLIAILFIAALTPVGAAPLGTAFTYQGRLLQNGSPMNGTADLRFSLWDAASGGSQVGSTIQLDDLPVNNGSFTAQINSAGQFGPNAFKGDARWINISLRPGTSTGSFTTLSPRQSVTVTPYSLHAVGPWMTTGTALTYKGGNVGIGADIPLTRLDVRGDLVLDSGGNPVLYTGTTNTELNRYLALINSPISPSASGLKAGGVLVADSYDYANPGKNDLIVKGNIGIGTQTPQHRLGIAGGNAWTSSQWGGAIELINGAAIGWQPDSSSQSFGIGQTNGGLYFFRTASYPGTTGASAVYDMIITDAGNVGIGTVSPSGRLHAEGTSLGIYGSSSIAGNSAGIYGLSPYIGIQGNTTGSDPNRQAIRGENYGSATGYAGIFNGNVWVVGTLTKPGGSFKIDHPLDPANKFLSHSFVESPDMKNIYDGIVITDANCKATITLPDWFMALNRDFRYQLTVIDAADNAEFIQAKVLKEIQNNQFTIRSSRPLTKVSWQVTGIRQDVWANAHRIPVEEDKATADRGKYIAPDLFGQPKGNGIANQSIVPPGVHALSQTGTKGNEQ